MKIKIFLTSFVAVISYSYCAFANFSHDCIGEQPNLKCRSMFSNNQCGSWFVTADFIYWTAREDGLDFGISGALYPAINGKIKEVNFNWAPGFKVGAGYKIPRSKWDLYFNYTWYKNHSRGSDIDPTEMTLQTYLDNSFDGITIPATTRYSSANADWHFRYQTLDMEIGRRYYFCDCLTLRPFVGLRAISTIDNFSIFYNIATLSTATVINNHQKFEGIGPRFGLCNSWYFSGGWNIFADGSTSLFYGRYRLNRFDDFFEGLDITLVDTTADSETTLVDTGRNIDVLRAELDFQLGIGWNGMIRNWYHYFLKAAFEQRIFLQHNQFVRFGGATQVGNFMYNNTNLSVYGLTVSAGCEF